MKNAKSTSVTKLISRFDSDLRKLIMQDLKSLNRTKTGVMDKIANSVAVSRLSVA